MPFQLFLLRHAETEPQQSGQSDFDRKLLPKGFEQISYLTQHLSEIGFDVDLIISSAAVRAKTTILTIAESLKIPINKIQFDQTIYHAEADGVLDIIKGVDDHIKRLLIVGHNPTLSDLTNHLIRNFGDGLRTCDLVWMELSIDHWQDIDLSKGQLKKVFTLFH